MLAVAGGAAGLLVAAGLLGLVQFAVGRLPFPLELDLTLDYRVLAYVLGLSTTHGGAVRPGACAQRPFAWTSCRRTEGREQWIPGTPATAAPDGDGAGGRVLGARRVERAVPSQPRQHPRRRPGVRLHGRRPLDRRTRSRGDRRRPRRCHPHGVDAASRGIGGSRVGGARHGRAAGADRPRGVRRLAARRRGGHRTAGRRQPRHPGMAEDGARPARRRAGFHLGPIAPARRPSHSSTRRSLVSSGTARRSVSACGTATSHSRSSASPGTASTGRSARPRGR